jgi:tetratricopeptide (TPR) repeat protein
VRCTAWVATAATLCACGPADRRQPRLLTFNKDIAPLIWRRCGDCHRPGEIGPFSLLEYPNVRSHAQQIVKVVRTGVMPPWLPEPGYGDFVGQRRLRPDEVSAIERWVEQGALEGDAANLPARPQWPAGWRLGKPDLVVDLPKPYALAADRTDVFRNFVIPLPLPAPRFVRGLEIRPTPPGVVHHATILFDRTRASRRLDAADPDPGYEGMFSEAARNPDSHALGWTPGTTPSLDPPEYAWRLERGSDLVIQLHMVPSGKREPVGLSVGFFFSDVAPTRSPIDVKIGSKTIDIPASDAGYVAEDRLVLPVDVDVLSVYPHAHYLAKEMKAFAALPDGTRKWLIWIKDWNFRWQDQYRYATPLFLPRGTTLTMQYTYDNSPANPRNPHRPPRRVVHGPQSFDEMGDLWLRLLPRTRDDAMLLVEAYREHELRAEIAGAEAQVAREPLSATSLNVLGIRYIEAGRVEQGIARLRDALRQAPNHAEAHNNLGHALQLQGRTAEAVRHFREAARLAPDNDRIHFNLAGALQDRGELDEAIRHLRQGLALNPDAADAHNSLGVALGSRGLVDEAELHFRMALDINPDDVDARRNLANVAELRRGASPQR